MDDTPALLAYLQQSVVTELTSFPTPSLALAEGIISRATNRWAAGEPSKWGLALHGSDQLIGTCGFNEWSPVHRWAELAYDLAPPHWGKGLMRQAVNAMLHWAFEQLRLGRIHAYVRTDNTRSKRLLERAGFAQEGRLQALPRVPRTAARFRRLRPPGCGMGESSPGGRT